LSATLEDGHTTTDDSLNTHEMQLPDIRFSPLHANHPIGTACCNNDRSAFQIPVEIGLEAGMECVVTHLT
jgi:hypothetical protein